MPVCRNCRQRESDPTIGRFCWECWSKYAIAELEQANAAWHAEQPGACKPGTHTVEQARVSGAVRYGVPLGQ